MVRQVQSRGFPALLSPVTLKSQHGRFMCKNIKLSHNPGH
ncbi:hypothetical protein HNQ09_000574 [Deinococcus budaensis]|uniref:Uncharacterized protein n=1 Tax=Deinococcus budaensis TaxID=1665626 RepID=A0A7W8GCT2_9DEIO|nr:hypothetical protein [Deinococcus budaensis]